MDLAVGREEHDAGGADEIPLRCGIGFAHCQAGTVGQRRGQVGTATDMGNGVGHYAQDPRVVDPDLGQQPVGGRRQRVHGRVTRRRTEHRQPGRGRPRSSHTSAAARSPLPGPSAAHAARLRPRLPNPPRRPGVATAGVRRRGFAHRTGVDILAVAEACLQRGQRLASRIDVRDVLPAACQ